ncbi:mariner Mos1 transposase [Trichonephila clavipes]|nr:mariner Mos1 transposase [Trichonephila clavipes]
MVTGDKKWVTYDNIVQKLLWSKRGKAAQTVVKPGLMAKKVLLCIWWDWKGIIYYELLLYGQILNTDLYCQQVDRLQLKIDNGQFWPARIGQLEGIVFHQVNTRLYTCVVILQKLCELGWEVLMNLTI